MGEFRGRVGGCTGFTYLNIVGLSQDLEKAALGSRTPVVGLPSLGGGAVYTSSLSPNS